MLSRVNTDLFRDAIIKIPGSAIERGDQDAIKLLERIRRAEQLEVREHCNRTWQPFVLEEEPGDSMEHLELFEAQWKKVQEAIREALDDRQRRVLLGRYLEGRTLVDIGLQEGITREWVRQIERKAVQKLKKYLALKAA